MFPPFPPMVLPYLVSFCSCWCSSSCCFVCCCLFRFVLFVPGCGFVSSSCSSRFLQPLVQFPLLLVLVSCWCSCFCSCCWWRSRPASFLLVPASFLCCGILCSSLWSSSWSRIWGSAPGGEFYRVSICPCGFACPCLPC